MARLCPHCENRCKFDIAYSNAEGRWGKPETQKSAFVRIQMCQECRGVIVVISFENELKKWEERIVYPALIPSTSDFVPDSVATDYISGVNCFAIHEYKAAATMFRRSLQQIMIDKKASIGDKLFKQIDDLAAKGIITNEIKDWAHEIRFWGNDGAHPATDRLDALSQEEVNEVKEFLERVFDYVYIMPGKLDASRKSRSDRKSIT